MPLLGYNLFLACDSDTLSTLRGSCVCMGALPSAGKLPDVPLTAIGAQVFEALDVTLNFAPQIAFDFEAGVDHRPDFSRLLF